MRCASIWGCSSRENADCGPPNGNPSFPMAADCTPGICCAVEHTLRERDTLLVCRIAFRRQSQSNHENTVGLKANVNVLQIHGRGWSGWLR